jgi:hypothetical protein
LEYIIFLKCYDRIHHFGLILKFWPNEIQKFINNTLSKIPFVQTIFKQLAEKS